MIWWCDNGADTWMCLAPTSTSAGLLPLPFHPWWSMGSYKPASLLPSPVLTSHGLMLCGLSMGRCQCIHRGLLSCSRLMLPFTYTSCSWYFPTCTCPLTLLTLFTKLMWSAITVIVATTAALEWALGGALGVFFLCAQQKRPFPFPFCKKNGASIHLLISICSPGQWDWKRCKLLTFPHSTESSLGLPQPSWWRDLIFDCVEDQFCCCMLSRQTPAPDSQCRTSRVSTFSFWGLSTKPQHSL